MTEEFSQGYPRTAAADLLAAVLATPEVLARVDLRPGDFEGTHTAIAAAVLHCRKVIVNEPDANLAEAVASHLERDGIVAQGGGAEALFATLVPEDSPARPEGAATLADIVRDHAERRRAVEHYMQAVKAFQDPATSLATARRLAAAPVEQSDAGRLPKAMTAAALVSKYPTNRPALIDGLLRRGEVGTLVNSSKSGKSWLLHQLALCVASGRDWLGMRVQAGKVLVLDLELHPEVLAFRMRSLAQAMELPEAVLAQVDCIAGRGTGVTVRDLAQAAPQLGGYALVVLDPLYRSFPEGTDENSNSQLTRIFDELDKAAEASGAAWLTSHHASKGGQAGKTVADVGAGAGSIARASDLHLVLRQHVVPGVSTLEAVVRSFPPVSPFCVTFDWPLWQVASEDLDPRDLEGAKPTQGQKVKIASQDAADDAEAVLAFLQSQDAPVNKKRVIAGVCASGRHVYDKRVDAALETLQLNKQVVQMGIKSGANKRTVPGYLLAEKVEQHNKQKQTEFGLSPAVSVCSGAERNEQDEQKENVPLGDVSFCLSACSVSDSPKKRSAKGTGKQRAARKRRPKKRLRETSPDAPESTPDAQDDQSPEQEADSVPSVAGERRATIVLDAADIVVREVSRGGA